MYEYTPVFVYVVCEREIETYEYYASDLRHLPLLEMRTLRITEVR